MAHIISALDFSLPLEMLLKVKSEATFEDRQRDFPSGSDTYFDIYKKTKELFNDKYYIEIDISANTVVNDGTVYTKHGLPHVVEVIKNAGELLGLNYSITSPIINGYECFLLLMSILVHDIGMYVDRVGHEEKCKKILLTHREELKFNMVEAKIISEIAESHSAKDHITQKYIDVFASIDKQVDSFGIAYRKRALGAILRFADELSEHSGRAFNFVEKERRVNDDSKIRHAYCKSIANIFTDTRAQEINVDYHLSADAALKKYNTKNGEIVFIDHIFNCLEKMDNERAYCTRYFAELLYLSNIKVNFNIFVIGDYDFQTPIIDCQILLGESGYPEINDIKSKLSNQISSKLINDKYTEYNCNVCSKDSAGES